MQSAEHGTLTNIPIKRYNTGLQFFKGESSYPPSEHHDNDGSGKSLIKHSFCLRDFTHTIYLADRQDVDIPKASRSRLHTAIAFPAHENEDLTDHGSRSSDSLMDVSTGESGYSPIHFVQEMNDNSDEIQDINAERESITCHICLKQN